MIGITLAPIKSGSVKRSWHKAATAAGIIMVASPSGGLQWIAAVRRLYGEACNNDLHLLILLCRTTLTLSHCSLSLAQIQSTHLHKVIKNTKSTQAHVRFEIIT